MEETSKTSPERILIAKLVINTFILGTALPKTAKDIFSLLNSQKKPNRLIIFATHNRFFANKADYLLELTEGSIKSTNA